MKNKEYFTVVILAGVTIILLSSPIPSTRVEVFSLLNNVKKDRSSKLDAPSHEIEALREEVAVLTWKLLQAQEKIASLTEFREEFPVEKVPSCIPASILVKRDSSPHRLSFVVDRGARDGVVAGSPVVFGNSLVGRVLEVGTDVSRVLYVADPKMRIAVILVPELHNSISYGEGICMGMGSYCQLKLVQKDYQKWSEAYVITASHNEYPPGLVIGRVKCPGREGQGPLNEEQIGMFWDLRVDPRNIDEIDTVLIFSTPASTQVKPK